MKLSLARTTLAGVLAVVLAGCSERQIAGPSLPVPEPTLNRLVCNAVVHTGVVTCTVPDAQRILAGAQFDRVIGGQDVYVKLASANTSYDGGAQVFRTDVTVQNLARAVYGTPDGATTTGVNVFFLTGPTVVTGSGNASVRNADGTSTFTNTNQAYFLYNQQLSPLQISGAKTWEFNVDNTVGNFAFTVAISTKMVDESVVLLDKVWQGDEGSSWSLAGNWRDNEVPVSSSAVSIPLQSQFAGVMPVLTGNVEVLHLRVGAGSTLGLANNTLTASGNVDAIGAISNGTLRMTGASTLLRGSVPSLQIVGSVTAQGSTVATGAVTISGGGILNISSNNPLLIVNQ